MLMKSRGEYNFSDNLIREHACEKKSIAKLGCGESPRTKFFLLTKITLFSI